MERCAEHSGMIERTKNIDDKCDAILSELRSTKKDIWDRVNQHIDESPAVRNKVVEIDTELRQFKIQHNQQIISSQWRIGLIVGCILAIIQLAAQLWKK